MYENEIKQLYFYFQIMCSIPGHAYHSPLYFENVTQLRQIEISKILKDIRQQIELILSSEESPISKQFIKYFKDRCSDGVPYIEFEKNPYQVSLIKKIINALYHGEQALIIFEADTNSRWAAWCTIILNLSPLISHAYEGMHSGNESGLELMWLIKPHLEVFNSHADKVKKIIPCQFVIKDFDSANFCKLLDIDSNASTSFQVGQLTGTLLDQLKPSQNYDYTLIATLSSKLPEVISFARNKLEELSQQAIKLDPSLNRKRFKDLKKQADTLLDTIKKLQINSFYNIENILHYIALIKKLLTLANVTLYEFQHLNESEHKIIKEYLLYIKYEMCAQIIIWSDELELTFVLEPGYLSGTILKYLNDYYQTVIDLLFFVKFDADVSGCQVLYLFDNNFKELRQKALQMKLDEFQIKKFSIDQAQEVAAARFFQKLNGHKSVHLAEMPVDVKQELSKNYHLLSDYFEKNDPKLNREIIRYLVQERRQDSKTIPGYLHWQAVQVKNFLTRTSGWFDINEQVLKIEDLIKSNISQSQNTTDFMIALSMSIYENIYRQYEFYKEKNSNYKSNFQHALTPFSSLDYSLSIESIVNVEYHKKQFLHFREIENKKSKLILSLEIFGKFIRDIKKYDNNNIFQFLDNQKEKLREKYLHIQPFIVLLFGFEGKVLDEQLVSVLNPSFHHDCEAENSEDLFFDKYLFIQKYEKEFIKMSKAHIKAYSELSLRACEFGTKHFINHINSIELLVPNANERETYLLKTKALSEKFEIITYEYDIYLSKLHFEVNNVLKIKSSFIPYPEVDLENNIIPEQLLVIKQFRNILFYIEKLIESFELLNDDSYQFVYAIQVLMGTFYAYSTYRVIDLAQTDPYFSSLMRKLVNLFDDVCLLVPNQIKPRNISANIKYKKNKSGEELIDYDFTLSPILDLLYELPLKINAFSNNKEINQKEKSSLIDISNAMRARIISVIDDSDHWTKWLFNAPEIIDILSFIRFRFNKVGFESYDAVLLHLKEIKKYLYVDVALKVIDFEIQFGLNSGAISTNLEKILEEIFNGFIKQLEISCNDKFILLNDVSYFDERLNSIHKEILLKKERVKKLDKALDELSSLLIDLDKLNLTNVFYCNFLGTANEHSLRLSILVKYKSIQKDYSGDNVNNKALLQIKEACKKLKTLKSREKETLLLDLKLYQSNLEFLRFKEKPFKNDYNVKIKKYIDQYFETSLKGLCSNGIEGSCIDLGYSIQLSKYIRNKFSHLVKSSDIDASKIEITIDETLLTLRQAFDEKNLQSFKKLSSVLSLLNAYSVKIEEDCDGSVSNSKIKSVKIARLNQVKDIIYNKAHSESATERLEKVWDLVEHDKSFELDLKKKMHTSLLSWQWFNQWWHELLAILKIEKHPDEKLIHEIKNTSSLLFST